MKRIFILLIAALMLIGLTACAGNTPANTAENLPPADKSEQTEPAEKEITPSSDAEETTASSAATEAGPDDTSAPQTTDPVPEHKTVLVVVFSATGTTKSVAEKIAAIEDADIYEIKAAQEYTSADLDWHDRGSRTTKEQNDKSARPEIAGDKPALDGYTTVYIGYPIWWGEEPRIMDTFVESCSFDGITVIPFCTSGGSGIGRSGKNLEENAGSGIWLDGERLSAGVSEQELQSWIGSLE